jgi:selenocysteine-specific elongation factor
MTVVAKDMFSKETDMNKFAHLPVTLTTGQTGFIDSAFGQSGKFKVRLDVEVDDTLRELLPSKSKRKAAAASQDPPARLEPVGVTLSLRKYVFEPKGKR